MGVEKSKTTTWIWWGSGVVIILCLLATLYLVQTNMKVPHFTPGGESNSCLHRTKFVQDNLEILNATDPRLIEYVRTRYLSPPAKREVPYVFSNPNTDKSTKFSKWVRRFLKDQKKGVFLEAGAIDGERGSHSLDLEISLGWTGLLIECNPSLVPYLRTKQRKAWVAGVCISTSGHPGVANFSVPPEWKDSGRVGAPWNLKIGGTLLNWTHFNAETVPLYSLIKAAGIEEIDYFSFDVEGAEFQVLLTFPFDLVTIKLMIVEVFFLDPTQRNQLEVFLHSKGFYTVEKIEGDYFFANSKHHSKNN